MSHLNNHTWYIIFHHYSSSIFTNEAIATCSHHPTWGEMRIVCFGCVHQASGTAVIRLTATLAQQRETLERPLSITASNSLINVRVMFVQESAVIQYTFCSGWMDQTILQSGEGSVVGIRMRGEILNPTFFSPSPEQGGRAQHFQHCIWHLGPVFD